MQTQIATRIPIELAYWLDDHAKASGKSKAQIVTQALEAYKAKQERGNKQ